MSAKDLFQEAHLESEEIDIKGVKFIVKSLPRTEWAKLLSVWRDAGAEVPEEDDEETGFDDEREVGLENDLLTRCVYDENDELVCDNHDEWSGKPYWLTFPLTEACFRLNGMGSNEGKDEGKPAS